MANTKTLRELRDLALAREEELELASTAGAAIGEGIHQAEERVVDTAHHARYAARSIEEKALQGIRDFRDLVARHPLPTTLIAFGVGLALAALGIRRR